MSQSMINIGIIIHGISLFQTTENGKILQFHFLNLEGRILFHESSSLLTLSTGQDLVLIVALDQVLCGSCPGLIGPFCLELLEFL